MATTYEYIHFPVEVASRELDAKLLFALSAARRGYRVILGEDRFFTYNIDRLPPGILIDKSFTRRIAEGRMIKAAEAGHFVTGIDEEGINAYNSPLTFRRFHPLAIRHADLIMAWGRFQARELAHRLPDAGDRIAITGHPRWDLLRPESSGYHARKAEAIRGVFGDFVLFTSNFALNLCPNVESLIALFAQTGVLEPGDTEALDTIHANFEYITANFRHMLNTLPRIAAALPDIPLIVRPHPQETHAPWVKAFEGLRNVHVLFEGAVEPWLQAARVVVMSGCTTGLQAVTMGTPALAYAPIPNEPLRQAQLSNIVCALVTDPETLRAEICRTVRDREAADANLHQARAVLPQHIANGDGGPLAADLMLAAIEARLADRPAGDRRPTEAPLVDHPATPHKFPPIDTDEVIGRLSALAATFNLPLPARVTRLRPNVFVIEPEHP